MIGAAQSHVAIIDIIIATGGGGEQGNGTQKGLPNLYGNMLGHVRKDIGLHNTCGGIGDNLMFHFL